MIKRINTSLLPILTGILLLTFLAGCGQAPISEGNILEKMKDSNFAELNEEIKLPDEFYFEGIKVIEEEKFESLEGEWEKKIYRWIYQPEKSLNIQNGIIETDIKFVPQKRFRFNFSIRETGQRALGVEIFYNRIKFVSVRGNTRIKLMEYPLSFRGRKNKIRILYFGDLVILSFNGKERGRFRSDDIPSRGSLGSFTVNIPNNPESGIATRYQSFDSEEQSGFAVFNKQTRFQSVRSMKKYIRDVKLGDITMPAALAPSPARIKMPVEIGAKTDLRFSIGVLPVAKPVKINVNFKIEFHDSDTEKQSTLFERSLPPGSIFDSEWLNCLVEMKKTAGKKGYLVFLTSIDNPDNEPLPDIIPLWGAPRLLKTTKGGITKNLILITAENFGNEALRLVSQRGGQASSLQNLQQNSVTITNIYPSSIWVPASLFTLFTGKYPIKSDYFSMERPPGPQDGDVSPTLANIFAKNGYDTASFGQGVHTHPYFGLSGGFNEYYTASRFPGTEFDISNTSSLINAASLWVERRKGKNLFLHLHFDLLSKIDEGQIFIKTNSERKFERNFWRLYSRQVSRLDGQIGRFIRSLWKMGALQNSIVIIMGINGTNVPSFNQKGIGSLGRDIYLRTPVIININRKFPLTGERSRYASAVNMYSTILDLMKLPLPEVSDSKSLASVIEADVMEGNEIVVTELFSPLNLYPALALREKRLKLHYFQPKGVEATEIFYDLQQDPNERRKLSSAPKDITNMLEKKLFSILEKLDMDIYSPEKNKWAAHYLRLITEERELQTD